LRSQARDIATLVGASAFLIGAGIASLCGVPCDVAAMRGAVLGACGAILAWAIARLIANLAADAVAARMSRQPEPGK
jgi:hypothetical protein